MNGKRFGITRRTALGASVVGLVLGLAACAPEAPRSEPSADPEPKRTTAPSASPQPGTKPELLLASLAKQSDIAVIDPALPDAQAVVRTISVGGAPWGLGVHAESGVAYAATAEGLAVVDLDAGKRTALVQYQHPAPFQSVGEYRPGGLGLAVSPDGSRVYVAVTTGEGRDNLEVFDTSKGVFVGSVAVGMRPFDVLVAPDGSWAATVDHDGFTVTVVDAVTLKPTQHTVAPFGTEGGLASWEKPHYGAVDADGTILLPYQGLVVARLDPLTGEVTTVKSNADSHSHGTALAGQKLLTVGTGAFGNANGEPNLSILNLESGDEQVVPLSPPHETVAVWTNALGAEFAALGGGNTRDEGWDGLTLVSLADLSVRSIPMPGYPQVVVSFAAR
ncbi:YncE family protein [Leucobacter coleopterorum]|nr:YncE family protein [Leucobacter coleopterorum]